MRRVAHTRCRQPTARARSRGASAAWPRLSPTRCGSDPSCVSLGGLRVRLVRDPGRTRFTSESMPVPACEETCAVPSRSLDRLSLTTELWSAAALAIAFCVPVTSIDTAVPRSSSGSNSVELELSSFGLASAPIFPRAGLSSSCTLAFPQRSGGRLAARSSDRPAGSRSTATGLPSVEPISAWIHATREERSVAASDARSHNSELRHGTSASDRPPARSSSLERGLRLGTTYGLTRSPWAG